MAESRHALTAPLVAADPATLCAELRGVGQGRGVIEEVEFEFPEFGHDSAWFRAFRRLYPTDVGLPFRCRIGAEQVTPRFVHELRRTGCEQVELPVVSACPTVRQSLGIVEDYDRVRLAFDLLARAGLRASATAVAGWAEENAFSFVESARELAALRLHGIRASADGADPVLAAGRVGRLPKHRRRAETLTRFVALYEAVDWLSRRQPRLALLVRRAVDCSAWFGRGDPGPDSAGRFGFVSWVAGARLDAWLADVARRERRLAGQHLTELARGDGWVARTSSLSGATRRESLAAAHSARSA